MAGTARVSLAAAYVLHQTPWRDSSRIYEVLTRDHGRLSLFARGVRGPKARLAGVLQPFAPLLVSFSLRGEAGNLSAAETQALPTVLPPLAPDRLMAGFYLSELVMKLTLRHDPQPEIYGHYDRAVRSLRAGAGVARELRLFEKRLLDSLGYGLDLRIRAVADSGPPGVGYHTGAVSAATLSSLAEERLHDTAELEEARQLLRRALASCLEGRTLKTRQVAEELRDLRSRE
jgi:DNA repair protein RecO (recombination protein O)